MRFENFVYLWPPRPEKAIPRILFPFYEKQGFIAQAKKNGTCNIIAVGPDKNLKCMNRHAEDHSLWSPSGKTKAIFQNLPGKGWYVFVAELLHSKVEGIRDINFINDILVADGEQLVGKTFAERYQVLRDLFIRGGEKETPSHYVLDANTWLAKNVSGNFKEFFESLTNPEDEGIVLKNPKSKLAPCSKAGSNVVWQVKSRRPTKNYTF